PMRSILVFAAFMLTLAVIAPRLISRHDAAATTAATEPSQPAANSRSVAIPRGQNGHFQTDGVVDGRRLGFLVDTGASVIALREGDAARLGIHPSQRDYTTRGK